MDRQGSVGCAKLEVQLSIETKNPILNDWVFFD